MMTDEEMERNVMNFLKFMHNPENEFNCESCPNNLGMNSQKYPCGQQNCWVTCHCYPERFENK